MLRHIEGRLTAPGASESPSSPSPPTAADALEAAVEAGARDDWDAVAWEGTSTGEAAEAWLGHRELTLVHLSACCVRAVRSRKLHKCSRTGAGWLARLRCGMRVHWRFDWLLLALLFYRFFLELRQSVLTVSSQLVLRGSN